MATYEQDGEPAWRLTMDGPHPRMGMDLLHRPAYRLKAERLYGDGNWDHRDASYFDGRGQLVRADMCVESLGTCYRWSVAWRGMFFAGYEAEAHGALWPFSDSESLKRSWRGTTLVIDHTGPVFDEFCFEYEGRLPVPVRSCDGSIRLASYESQELQPIEAWPDASARIAAGTGSNELFPGAEMDLQGHGFTTLQALEALRVNSAEAAATLLAGGCVLTTLFGHGSGGFGNGLSLAGRAFERPLANTSFTLQNLEGGQTKHTVTWVEDLASGEHRFSREIAVNEPDLKGGPQCGGEFEPAWPAIRADEFLALMAARFGQAGEEGFFVTRQSTFLGPAASLKYSYDGTHERNRPCWCGAAMTLDADQGRMVYAQYISDNDLEPDENG